MDLDLVRTFVSVADLDSSRRRRLTWESPNRLCPSGSRRWSGRWEFVCCASCCAVSGSPWTGKPSCLMREMLAVEERAIASVRPGHRALRIDPVSRRIAPGLLLRDFHQAHPEVALDVVTLLDASAAVEAVQDGTLDATFRAVTDKLPSDLNHVRIIDDELQLLVGPTHPLASARRLSPSELVGHRIWMPGNTPGTEWAAYYDEFAAAFDLTIDTIGPNWDRSTPGCARWGRPCHHRGRCATTDLGEHYDLRLILPAIRHLCTRIRSSGVETTRTRHCACSSTTSHRYKSTAPIVTRGRRPGRRSPNDDATEIAPTMTPTSRRCATQEATMVPC